MAGAENHEQTREAETAVLQLLEATNTAKRKRAADGTWRPQTGSNSGAGDGPGQAILRLSGLYSSSSCPPVLLIRHPQVASSPHTVNHLGILLDGIIRNSSSCCVLLTLKRIPCVPPHSLSAVGKRPKHVIDLIVECRCSSNCWQACSGLELSWRLLRSKLAGTCLLWRLLPLMIGE